MPGLLVRMVGELMSFQAGDRYTGLDGFWRLMQQFRLLSFKAPAVINKGGPLQSFVCWLADPHVHGGGDGVFESFELCCLGQHVDSPSIFKRL